MAKRLSPLLLALLVVGLVIAGRLVRARMGVDYTPESFQAWVAGLGLQAPLVFLGVVTFRQFLLLPSMLVLTVGGLAFGAVLGTALGALGIVLSATVGFSAARGLGREFVQRRVGVRFREFEARMQQMGLALVALATGHPMGPMTPFHWGAGFTSIRALPFLATVAAAALLRAFAYAFFGATLLESGDRVYVAMALLLAAALLPLAHPGVRRRILGAVPGRLDR